MTEEMREEQHTNPNAGGPLSRICNALILQSPVSTWIADRNGTNIFENEASRRMFGITGDAEVIGKYSIFKDEVLAQTPYMPQIRKVFEKGGSTELVVDYDAARLQHVRISNPTHKILRVFLFAIRDASGRIKHVIIQHEDLTKQVMTERNLERSEARFRELVEDVSDWVWEVNLEGRYTYSSPVVERILGYRPDEIIGRSVFDLIIPEDREIAKTAFEAAVRDKREITRLLNANRHKDGSIRYLETSGEPTLGPDGELIGYRGIDRDVTDRIKAERALKAEKEHFQHLIENATDLITVLDPDGMICFESPSLTRMLGYQMDESVGHSVYEFLHPDDIEDAREAIAKAIREKGTVVSRQVRVRHKDGSWHYLEATATGIDDESETGRVVINSRDITKRKMAQEALKRSEAEMRALIKAMNDVVLVINSEGRYVCIAPTSPSLLYKPPDELLGKTLHEVLPREQADWFLESIRQALDTRQTVNIEYPLVIEGREVWFTAAISPMADSEVIWVARDITRLKNVEEALRGTADKLTALVSASPIPIITGDLEGLVTSWNPAAERVFGWKAEEVIGSPLPIVAEESVDRYRELQERQLRGEVICNEHLTGRTKDGSLICMSVTHAAMHDAEGRVIGFMGLIEDVTERVRAASELRESEEKFRTLAENANAAIGIVQGRHFVYANPYLETASGYSHDELLDMDISELIAPEHRQMVLERARRRQAGVPEPGHYEFKMITKSGEERWLDFSPALITYRGAPAVVGVAYDITERKRAEQSLSASEKNLREIIEHAPASIMVYDRNGIILQVNEALERQLGYSADQLVGKPYQDTFGRAEDRERAKENIRRVFSGETLENVESTGIRPDGSTVYAIVSTTPIFNDKGEVEKAVAVGVDITERKHAEDAIRMSEQNFRSLFDSMPGTLFAYDREGNILQVNPAFERTFGFDRQQVIGRSMFDVIALPENRGFTLNTIEQVFQGKTVENMEQQLRRADGSTIYMLSNATPVYGPAGEVMIGLCLGIDITERKVAERRAAELEEHKRDFYRRTILAATEGKLEITERDAILRVAGPTIASWHIRDADDLTHIRRDLEHIASSAGMDPDRLYDFVLATGEAITNAFKHAGGGKASLHRTGNTFTMVVSDAGRGMEALALPELAFTKGYTTARSLGMGYKAILSIADKVYLATGPTGTTVGIEMGLQPVEAPSPFAALPDTW